MWNRGRPPSPRLMRRGPHKFRMSSSGAGVVLLSERPDPSVWGAASDTWLKFHAKSDTDSGRRTRLRFLCGREAGRLVRHESRRQAMARVAGHLSVEDLEAGFRSARDPTATRHV